MQALECFEAEDPDAHPINIFQSSKSFCLVLGECSWAPFPLPTLKCFKSWLAHGLWIGMHSWILTLPSKHGALVWWESTPPLDGSINLVLTCTLGKETHLVWILHDYVGNQAKIFVATHLPSGGNCSKHGTLNHSQIVPNDMGSPTKA